MALSDGVVQLRAFADADAPALAAIWTDTAIRARNEVPEPSEDAAREWVASRGPWEWAIVDVATGELAGRRALKDVDWDRRRAEAACWVAPRFRGRHFAARSLRVAAAHAFDHGLEAIDAECETDNEAAFRSLVAAGLRQVGTRREPPAVHVFELLPEDLAGAVARPWS